MIAQSNRQFRHGRRRTARSMAAVVVAFGCVLASHAGAQTPTVLPTFDVDLTTNHGCLENGDNATFTVGDLITVRFSIGSDVVPQANATLFDVLSNGFVNVFGFGPLATNVIYAFQARVAPPLGVEQLVLKATATGVRTGRRSCSFVVLGAGSTATPTPPQATATPTSTRTGTPVMSVTPTRTPAVSAEVRTNRGCTETGDAPVFGVGERITVSFQADSTSQAFVTASLADVLANGLVNIFSFGVIPTNVELQLHGFVTPPLGTETLQLRVRSFNGQLATATCSFQVVTAPPATATRTATPTATPTATHTP